MAEINIYTPEEIADILKLSRRTIYTYIKEGKLQAFKIGKRWRVSEEALKQIASTGTDTKA